MKKKFRKINSKIIFLIIFILLSVYFLFIKAELYESQTSLIVQDLSSSSPASNIGLQLLGVGSSSQLQDSMVVKEFLESLDMFLILDKKFGLIQHYKSDKIDFIERLRSDATIEDDLKFYQKRLKVHYDETSGILHIAYAYTDAKTTQKILEFMIKQVEYALNEFNRKKAKKQLSFIELEYKKNKEKMLKSVATLQKYQNEHLLLDPETQATSSSALIADLESKLSQKKIEYKTKSTYLNSDNYELLRLKSEIKEIEHSLVNIKKSLAGKSKNRLNKILFAYNRLKMQLDFDTEVYKNTLLQLETTKLDILKKAKTLSLISKPNLPDGYTYPNKPRVFITIVIAMLLLYGIFAMLLAIIKDHKE